MNEVVNEAQKISRLKELTTIYGDLPSLWHGPDRNASQHQIVSRWAAGLPVTGPDAGPPEELCAVITSRGAEQALRDQTERFELARALGDREAARAALFTIPAITKSVEPATDMLLKGLQTPSHWDSTIAVIERLDLPESGRIREALQAIASDTVTYPVMLSQRASRLVGSPSN
jgi:hypothetical protein